MILTQKMIDKLSAWKARDQENSFTACFIPPEFTEKYLPDGDRLYKPITQIEVLAEMIGIEEFFVTISRGAWLVEVKGDEDNLELLIALEKEKYYTEKLTESILEKEKILGVA